MPNTVKSWVSAIPQNSTAKKQKTEEELIMKNKGNPKPRKQENAGSVKQADKEEKQVTQFASNASGIAADMDIECISVHDAAVIWAANGRDSRYTFGFSEEVLEDAL